MTLYKILIKNYIMTNLSQMSGYTIYNINFIQVIQINHLRSNKINKIKIFANNNYKEKNIWTHK